METYSAKGHRQVNQQYVFALRRMHCKAGRTQPLLGTLRNLFWDTLCSTKTLDRHWIIVLCQWNFRIIKWINWKLWFRSFISIFNDIICSWSNRRHIQKKIIVLSILLMYRFFKRIDHQYKGICKLIYGIDKCDREAISLAVHSFYKDVFFKQHIIWEQLRISYDVVFRLSIWTRRGSTRTIAQQIHDFQAVIQMTF